LNKQDYYEMEILPVLQRTGMYRVIIRDKEGEACHTNESQKKLSPKS
jgi:hypothetical protein